MHTTSARRLLLSVALAFACVSASAPPAPAAPKAPPGSQQGEPPLSSFSAQKVAVMPVQFLRADSTAPVKATGWAELRKELDDSIGSAIAARGIGKKWAYAADILRMAKRNSDYVSDPYSLGAAGFRDPRKKIGDPAPTPFVANLRPLISLGDARFALVPVDLSFATKAGETRPVLHVVLVDGRAGQIGWFADVSGAPGTKFSSAEVGALAQRVADLVAPR